jgi:hypothetical protein
VYSGQGSYTITLGDAASCEGLDEQEPNDTIDQADDAWWDSIEGNACVDDSDWYVLDGQEGNHPTFTLSFDDENLEVDWQIFNNDQSISLNTNYGSPESVTVDVPGTCYIHVWQFSGEGPYSIGIQ